MIQVRVGNLGHPGDRGDLPREFRIEVLRLPGEQVVPVAVRARYTAELAEDRVLRNRRAPALPLVHFLAEHRGDVGADIGVARRVELRVGAHRELDARGEAGSGESAAHGVLVRRELLEPGTEHLGGVCARPNDEINRVALHVRAEHRQHVDDILGHPRGRSAVQRILYEDVQRGRELPVVAEDEPGILRPAELLHPGADASENVREVEAVRLHDAGVHVVPGERRCGHEE